MYESKTAVLDELAAQSAWKVGDEILHDPAFRDVLYVLRHCLHRVYIQYG